LDDLDEHDELEELDELDELDELEDLDELDELEDLDELDELEEQHIFFLEFNLILNFTFFLFSILFESTTISLKYPGLDDEKWTHSCLKSQNFATTQHFGSKMNPVTFFAPQNLNCSKKL